ncbi:hypothetical protein LUU34_00921200 [Aix galericulata]|nr:hypothetical protein LUU34_00921200 [Aix galericulata]
MLWQISIVKTVKPLLDGNMNMLSRAVRNTKKENLSLNLPT